MSETEKQKQFEHLVTAYSGWLYRYAYWITGEKQTSEDLVQETFLRAWRFLDSLKEESAAKSWLTTILRRENARRFERKQLEYSDVELDSLPATHADIDARPEIVALRIALKKLPLSYREPLILQVIEGYTLEDIAKIMSLPRNTVATRLHRARQKLKQQLENDEERTTNELS
jgi:RNA polymerase sigma-70 factor (ECF subfamily)